MTKCLISWSSGKDSAWMVHVLRQQPDIELGRAADDGERSRISAWRCTPCGSSCCRRRRRRCGCRCGRFRSRRRARTRCTSGRWRRRCTRAVGEGFTHVAFGDLFLEDIRRYREERLAGTGLTPIFPLFGADTTALAREMIAGGLRARITCVNPKVLDQALRRPRVRRGAARRAAGIDRSLRRARRVPHLRLRRPDVRRPIPIESGEVVERDGFVFADVLPIVSQ